MGTGRAGHIEIGGNFDPNLNDLVLKPPRRNGVGKSESVITQILSSIAELVQSRTERLFSKHRLTSGNRHWANRFGDEAHPVLHLDRYVGGHLYTILTRAQSPARGS